MDFLWEVFYLMQYYCALYIFILLSLFFVTVVNSTVKKTVFLGVANNG